MLILPLYSVGFNVKKTLKELHFEVPGLLFFLKVISPPLQKTFSSLKMARSKKLMKFSQINQTN